MTSVQQTGPSSTLDQHEECDCALWKWMEEEERKIGELLKEEPSQTEWFEQLDLERESRINFEMPALNSSLDDGWWVNTTTHENMETILPTNWKHIPKQTVILDGPLYCFGWEEDLKMILAD